MDQPKAPQEQVQSQSTYKCMKCNHPSFSQGMFYAAGGFWSKIFDIQGTKFITKTCEQCGFTEIYKGNSKGGSTVLDIIT